MQARECNERVYVRCACCVFSAVAASGVGYLLAHLPAMDPAAVFDGWLGATVGNGVDAVALSENKAVQTPRDPPRGSTDGNAPRFPSALSVRSSASD